MAACVAAATALLLLAGLVAPASADVCNSAASVSSWIDSTTPATACTKAVCTSAYPTCTGGAAPPTEDMVLVFSDEFTTDGRKFNVSDGDKAWLGVDLYYSATADSEVYKPDAVTTVNGKLVLTMTKEATNVSANTQAVEGWTYPVSRPYKSGMVQSWNKFCFTGGYLEASVKLPGTRDAGGLWPAIWMMGNLGRAGLVNQTMGLWPYSYNECRGSWPQQWDGLPGQKLSACPDYLMGRSDRVSQWGLWEEQGRGAPEIDLFEVFVYGWKDDKGSHPSAGASQTLQMAPIMPRGTHWVYSYDYTDKAGVNHTWLNPFYVQNNLSPGAYYPGSATKYHTSLNTNWCGYLSVDYNGTGSECTPHTQPPRPGSDIQDSISSISDLDDSFFTSFQKWGLDWSPGEYIRWYLNDRMVYEVNNNALLSQTNTTGHRVGTRLIPEEPMYLIMNLGMSESFVKQSPDLVFPAAMQIDYVRLYQKKGAISVDCSPKDYPTAEYIYANKKSYLMNPWEDSLIQPPPNTASGGYTRVSAATTSYCSALGLGSTGNGTMGKVLNKVPKSWRTAALVLAVVSVIFILGIVAASVCYLCHRGRGRRAYSTV